MQRLAYLFILLGSASTLAQPLPSTEPLTREGDLAAEMVSAIDAHLDTLIEESVATRARHWNRDTSSPEAYEASIAPNRERFRTYIGAVDERLPIDVNHSDSFEKFPLGRSGSVESFWCRWPVFPGVHGEGLILQPTEKPKAAVVLIAPEIPDPTRSLHNMAAMGSVVVVPMLIDIDDEFSGNPEIRYTNQTHREYIYRAAFQLGRHIIGYEVQKMRSLIDYLESAYDIPIGVIGRGEAGLIAMYTAALDTRIAVTGVSGYFGPREGLWQEPIYRNVWGVLDEFGDAEIATLIAPRKLIIDPNPLPEIAGPPPERDGRRGAAPGVIKSPTHAKVSHEVNRAQDLTKGLSEDWIELREGHDFNRISDDAMGHLFTELGIDSKENETWDPKRASAPAPDPKAIMQRQVQELVDHNMHLMRESSKRRVEFWKGADPTNIQTWEETTESYKDYLWDEVFGRFPAATEPAKATTRLVYDEPTYRGYEVLIPLWGEVFAYGILLLPKDIAEGERRPVVVCQHGLEGRPQDLADPKVENQYYHQYACKLAEKGYVVYAPQNPYIGGDAFRVLQRKANPLKKSIFGVIVRQHEQTLAWLKAQPFTDPDRIAFYGLSYGGKTAMRIPALLEDYRLSICSADYNEWIWKCCSYDAKYSYIFTGEYEMFEWNLANTFNYAELSWLILPRPFMVERGHHDGVAPDEWVGYEYARTQRRYNLLGIGDRTEIEWFDGPHMINGVGTFAFLDKWLGHD